jgi:aminoglycoside 3-N-acetyltransferase
MAASASADSALDILFQHQAAGVSRMSLKIKARELAKRIVRRLTGKEDIRAYVRLRRLEFKKRLHRKEITLGELRQTFGEMGVAEGRTIWFQSSWNEFYNYKGTPSSIINLLLEMIGPDGTLVMLATPLSVVPGEVLHIDRAPVSTGMICEVFRRYKGVRRSIHQSASVIALGPQAEYLTRDHHNTLVSWDSKSPFWRLTEVDALCLSAGNWRFLASLAPLHAVEAALRMEIAYFHELFTGSVTYVWENREGQKGEHTYMTRKGAFDAEKFGRLYPAHMSKQKRLSNLEIWSISARDAINTGIALGRQGKTMYFDPKPRAELFKPLAAREAQENSVPKS